MIVAHCAAPCRCRDFVQIGKVKRPLFSFFLLEADRIRSINDSPIIYPTRVVVV